MQNYQNFKSTAVLQTLQHPHQIDQLVDNDVPSQCWSQPLYLILFQMSQQLDSSISQGLSRRQIKQLDEMFESSQLKMYFDKLSPRHSINQLVSVDETDKIINHLDGMINEGMLEVGKKKKQVDLRVDQNKINQEEHRVLEMKIKKEYIERQLDYLKQQTSVTHKNGDLGEIDDGGIVLSKEEHSKLVLRMKKERRVRDRKHSQFLQKMDEKSREEEENRKKSIEEKSRDEQKNKREEIQRKLKENHQKHQQFIKNERESKQKVRKIKEHKFVYQQIQDKYQNTIVLSNLQQKKKKLKQLREYKSFNIEELKEHEKQYMEKKLLMQSRRTTIGENWNYHPPPRSERLTVILEEERLQEILKLEHKKKQLDQNLNRQENFVTYLKEHFVPRVDPIKKEEMEKRLEKSKVEKPELADLKEIGMAYLEVAKKRRKKTQSMNIIEEQNRPQTQKNPAGKTIDSNETKSRAATNYLSIDRNTDQHYEHRRRRNIQRLMKNKQLPEPQRIKQLKMQADKIGQNIRMKQKQLKYKSDSKKKQDTLQLLLSSIQAKIGIIEMYQ